MIGEVGQGFYQLDYVTSKNILWSVNCTLFYNQIYSAQMASLYRGGKVGIYSKKLHTRKYFKEKSHDHIPDVIYTRHFQELFSM